MENYNINRNQEPLSESDIAKGQNFDAFMNAYSAKQPSFLKTTKFYVLAAVTGVVLIGGTYLITNSDEAVMAENPSFIQPLFAGANDADTGFTVDATAGGLFFNSNGSIISVPHSAFLDSAGNPVSGVVELRYKEFHDPAKIFMAGIPMTYDSAGTQYNFESAGMMEITAWQNGKPLKVNPDSMIHVAIVSNTDEERFNTYYLDTTAKQWKYINDAKAVTFNPPVVDSTAPSKAVVINEAPVAPKVADKNKPSFAIAFDPTEFPELVAYKGVRFEVDENQTPYNKDDKKVQWEDVVINRIKNKNNFRVTFSAGSREAVYITQPVVDQKDFAAAQKSWEQRNAEYEAGKKAREVYEAKLASANEKAMEELDRHRIWVNDTLAERARQMRAAANLQGNTETMVMREFIVSDFGIWNSDCPMSMPEGMEIFAKTEGPDGKPLEVGKVCLVQKNVNALYQYYNLAAFRFDTIADNMLWAITKDGRLAVCQTDDFNAAIEKMKKDKAEAAIFKFQVSSGIIKNGIAARNMLGIPDLTGQVKEKS
jgi:hypothetical protein